MGVNAAPRVRAEISDVMTEAKCLGPECKHWGEHKDICREYDDCPIKIKHEPVDFWRRDSDGGKIDYRYDPRRCQHCGRMYQKPRSQTEASWWRRKYCDWRCAALARAIQDKKLVDKRHRKIAKAILEGKTYREAQIAFHCSSSTIMRIMRRVRAGELELF